MTAHPDDECMFFGPTLCHLADRNIQAKVLCLSTGNFYGKGKGCPDQSTKVPWTVMIVSNPKKEIKEQKN